MSERNRLLAAVGVVVLLVLGAVVTGTDDGTPATAVLSGARLGTVGASTTWYCAEGTANPGGRADEDVEIGNVGRATLHAALTVDGGADARPVVRSYDVAPGRGVRVHVADVAPIADPGVVVETRGGRGVVTHTLVRDGDTAMGPCAREPQGDVRFAAGTTSKGAELWLALFNPFPDDAIVDVDAVTDSGRRVPGRLQGIVVPRLTRLSVPVHDSIARVDTVAVHVAVRRGRVIAEQSQFLDGTDGRKGLGLSEASVPATRWWFPIADAGTGWQQRFVLVNPGSRDASVRISFALEAAAAVEPLELVLPAASVVTPDLSRVPDDVAYSAVVRSSRPIVAEGVGAALAPQPAAQRGIAADPGFAAGARTWAVSPSHLGQGSGDVLAVVATDGRRHRVRVVVPTEHGPTVRSTASVPAVGRAVLDLAKVTANPDRAVLVVADGPVVVERESQRPGFTRSHAVPG
jgi:hypothetical protein